MTNLEDIKSILQEKLAAMIERSEDIDDDLTEPADDDWGEAAVEAAGDEVLEEVGDVTLEEIAQIKQALARIENGGYGLCMSCGEDIGAGRLKVLPYATKCMSCAE